jgi:hypothetical protein
MFTSPIPPQPKGRQSERGATLTGYALTVAVMVVVALGSMSALEDNSEDFLQNTGDEIGAPRESAQVANATAQQSYNGGNSTGNGAAPPATAAPNVSTTTTTAAPTTTTTAAPTTTTSTPAPVPQATAGYSYNGSQSYYNDPAGAVATGIVSTVSLVSGDAGTYRVEFQLLASGGGSADSFFVDYGAGLKRYNTQNNVSSPTWQTQGVSGGIGVTTILITLAQGETLDVSLYPREPGVSVGDVRIVKVG